jgi:hypothetical protein
VGESPAEVVGVGERLGVSLGPPETEAQGEGECEGDAEVEAEPLPVAVGGGERVPAAPLREGAAVPEGREVSVEDTVAVKEGVTENEALGEGVGEGEPEPRAVREGEALAVASREAAGAADAEAPPPGEAVARREADSGGEGEGVPPVGLPLREPATLPVAPPGRPSKEGEREPEVDTVALPPPPPVCEGSCVLVGDTLGERDAEGAAEREGEIVGEGEFEGELGGVPVRATVPDAPREGEGALDAVAEAVAHAVGVAAGVDVVEPDEEVRASGERDVEPEAEKVSHAE